MKLIFRDIDGTKYYVNSKGDIVDHDGRLVSLTTEANIRALVRAVEEEKGKRS